MARDLVLNNQTISDEMLEYIFKASLGNVVANLKTYIYFLEFNGGPHADFHSCLRIDNWSFYCVNSFIIK